MKNALYFISGLIVGFSIGILIRKKKKNNPCEPSEAFKPNSQMDIPEEKEVSDVLKQLKYVNDVDEEEYYYAENEDDTQIQSDLDEIDEYLSGLEHPEDDEPAPTPDFVAITEDDYYTERHEFDKIKLYLDEGCEHLTDITGDDYADLFANHGLSMKKIMEYASSNDGVAYYRNHRLSADYAIYYEGGESG